MFKNKARTNRAVLTRLTGKPIRYVAARDEHNVEEVIGRAGRIVLKDDEVQINCEGQVVFRCAAKGAEITELLSLGGARVTGDMPQGRRSVTVYFTGRQTL